MSEILKTESVVLSKLNYGDTSLIVSLFTKEMGKISAILKGARSPKSKIGMKIDPINYVEVVFYNKDTRDLQIISSADLLEHYSKIKEDLEKLKYAYSVIELVKNLTPEHEQNVRLFNGIVRILSLFESSGDSPNLIFARFFLFFLHEIGYEVQLEKCMSCGLTDLDGLQLSYNFSTGLLCDRCKSDYLESFAINLELFNCLKGLKTNKKLLERVNSQIVDRAIFFMEKYLMYHLSDFKGIQSLKLFK
ncbi:MAG: DNA repair protein RecO [Ignavibacteriaceae bacterium]